MAMSPGPGRAGADRRTGTTPPAASAGPWISVTVIGDERIPSRETHRRPHAPAGTVRRGRALCGRIGLDCSDSSLRLRTCLDEGKKFRWNLANLKY